MNRKIFFAIFISAIMLISSFAVFDSVTYSQPTSNPIPANISPGYTTYTINLKGVPSGTGTYTQLITITNPVDYEINNRELIRKQGNKQNPM